MKPYDNYEISPCTRTEMPDKPGHFYFEVCEPHEADVWTLYGHCPEGGVESIGDFATREAAEAAFQRILGIPFGGHEVVAAWVKLMHAAGRLLEACRLVVGRWERGDLAEAARACDAAISEATADTEPPLTIDPPSLTTLLWDFIENGQSSYGLSFFDLRERVRMQAGRVG